MFRSGNEGRDERISVAIGGGLATARRMSAIIPRRDVETQQNNRRIAAI
jgi:hypothetical protein